jgi:hypothetical protein
LSYLGSKVNIVFFEIYKYLGLEYGLPAFLSKQIIEPFDLETEQYYSNDDFYIDEVFEKGNLRDCYSSLLKNV